MSLNGDEEVAEEPSRQRGFRRVVRLKLQHGVGAFRLPALTAAAEVREARRVFPSKQLDRPSEAVAEWLR